MKKTIKSFFTVIFTMTFFINCADASVLGSKIIKSTSEQIAGGTYLYNNRFLSDDKSVGLQTEYFAEYIPNDDVAPIVITGDKIYGKRTAPQAEEYMRKNGMVPMLGINASFFSFQTGIPMGHVIEEGYVTSKDTRALQGVGFKKDNTAFMDELSIETVAYFGDDLVLQIPHINKFISSSIQVVTLFTPDFGEYTGTDTETLNVVLSDVSDGIKIGSSLTCKVKSILTSPTPVKINKGEMVLSIKSDGNPWALPLMHSMYEQEEITIKTTASSDIWNDAVSGLASEGERLINNGVIPSGLGAGADPRTAVGITSEGHIIFYVLDGRQKNYSYGATKTTLAKRLKEIGCVDALNLDGGGSTTMTGVYPGSDCSSVINKPSEGALRKVTNFIFLKNMREPDGIAKYLFAEPKEGKILSGSTVPIGAAAYDRGFYKAEAANVAFTSSENGSFENNMLTANGEGIINISLTSQEATGNASYNSITSLDDIKLINCDNAAELNEIYLRPGEGVRLKADAYLKGEKLMSSNNVYTWRLSDTKSASVDQNGFLKTDEYFLDDTVLTVSAFGYSKSFVVKCGKRTEALTELYPYSEIKISDGVLTVDMYSYNDGFDMEKTFVRVDGEIMPSDSVSVIDDRHIAYNYSVGNDFCEGYHKIYCEAVLNNSHSAIGNLSVKNKACKNVFGDTNEHWVRDTASYMNSMGIVNGSYDKNGRLVFEPDKKITRAEFAAMAVNFLRLNPDDYKEVSLKAFSDEKNIPLWAENYIKAAYENKIISGKADGEILNIAPDDYITRAEAAVIISRMLPEGIAANDISFADNSDISPWSKLQLRKLVTSRLMSGYDDNTLKPQYKVTRAEAVTLFYNIY